MLLTYKEDHKLKRNIDKTHNPKVEGSNPSPATKSFLLFMVGCPSSSPSIANVLLTFC
jgi:hypothetical protein